MFLEPPSTEQLGYSVLLNQRMGAFDGISNWHAWHTLPPETLATQPLWECFEWQRQQNSKLLSTIKTYYVINTKCNNTVNPVPQHSICINFNFPWTLGQSIYLFGHKVMLIVFAIGFTFFDSQRLRVHHDGLLELMLQREFDITSNIGVLKSLQFFSEVR